MNRLRLFAIACVITFGYQLVGVQSPVIYAQTQDTWLQVSIPPLADIQLKDGNSITGRVKALTATSMTVEFGGTSSAIPLDTVSKIKFRTDKLVVSGANTLAIRGNKSLVTTSGTRVWQNVPLGGFKFTDQSKGLVEVNLTSVLKPAEFRGVKAVSKTSPYVIEEILFTSNQVMNVRVTPTTP